MPGQAHDLRKAATLIRGPSAGHLLTDRAFDSDWLRIDLLDRDINPIIPPKSNGGFRQRLTGKLTNRGTLSITTLAS